MKRLTLLCALLFGTLGQGLAQEFERPWQDWEPPVVEMPEPNAFELYQEAFDLIEEYGEVDLQDDPEALREGIEQHRLTFRLLEEAMMGECRLPPVTEENQPLQHLSGFRKAARLLTARASVYWEDGRPAEAALDSIACVRLGADAARGQPLIAGLLSVACQAIGLKALDDMIPSMQPDDCRIAIAALRAAEAERVTLAETTEGEVLWGKLMMKKQFAQISEDALANAEALGLDPEEIEKLKEQLELWQPADSWHAYDEFFAAVIEQARKPYWDREGVPKPGDPLVDILAPVYERTGFKFALADARLRLSMVHLATQAYVLEKGLPPADLAALAPEYLPYVPDDPFADAELRSAIKDGDLLIYSVGPDGLDGGGTEIEGIAEPESAGDIVVVL